MLLLIIEFTIIILIPTCFFTFSSSLYLFHFLNFLLLVVVIIVYVIIFREGKNFANQSKIRCEPYKFLFSVYNFSKMQNSRNYSIYSNNKHCTVIYMCM